MPQAYAAAAGETAREAVRTRYLDLQRSILRLMDAQHSEPF